MLTCVSSFCGATNDSLRDPLAGQWWPAFGRNILIWADYETTFVSAIAYQEKPEGLVSKRTIISHNSQSQSSDRDGRQVFGLCRPLALRPSTLASSLGDAVPNLDAAGRPSTLKSRDDNLPELSTLSNRDKFMFEKMAKPESKVRLRTTDEFEFKKEDQTYG